MKQRFTALTVLCVVCAALAFAFAPKGPQNQNSARVQVINGYSVFICSRPLDSFSYIQSVGIVSRDSTRCNFKGQIITFLKYVKDSVPGANGIIIPTLSLDTVHVIHLK